MHACHMQHAMRVWGMLEMIRKTACLVLVPFGIEEVRDWEKAGK